MKMHAFCSLKNYAVAKSHYQLLTLSLFFLFSLATNTLEAQQVMVRANQSTAKYQIGETVLFDVTSTSSGQATYVIKHDNYSTIISSGTVFLFAGQNHQIPYTATEAGAVFCFVTLNNNTGRGVACIDPLDIQPFEPAPNDFDAFWNGMKGQLAAVPIDPQLTLYSNTAYSTTYKLSLGSIDGRRVYGYISVPTGSGPFPGFITFPSFGNAANLVQPEWAIAERGNALSIALSIHNAPPDQIDPNGYQPDIATDPNTIYYKYAIIAGMRAIDYLYSRSDFDGSSIGAVGVSQGGGLAVLTAGIDQRVKLLAYSNSSHCQHSGLKYNKASGFPFYIHAVRSANGSATEEAATLAAAKYYDVAYAAARFNGPVLLSTSYEDETAPAATQFAASNQFSGTKVLLHNIEGGHADNPDEYWSGRYDFFRRHFLAMQNPPWPFAPSTTGFYAFAGDDRNVASGASVNLNGLLEINSQINPALTLEWKKVSGPGNVFFSNANNYNTTASFSADGTYVLQLSGEDYTLLSANSKYYTISDQITITVGNGGGDNIPPTVNLSTPNATVSGDFTVNVNFSETVNGLTLDDFDVTNANLSNLFGSDANYSITVSPQIVGIVNLSLPADRANDVAGNANIASNSLAVDYSFGSGDEVDLELSLSADQNSFGIYENVTYTLRVSNTGTGLATGVRIDFKIPTNMAFVNSNSSAGLYINWSAEWDLGSLNGGASETLEMTLFTLTESNPVTAYAQLIALNETDVDSSPNNNSGPIATEDDEVALTLTPGSGIDNIPPTVNLTTANANVSGDFVVNLLFDEPINGLSLADFSISNALGSGLSGSGLSYSFNLSPLTEGSVSVQLPANSVNDAAGNGNIVSNSLTVVYSNGGGGDPTGYCTAMGNQPWQDWIGNVSFADLDNDSNKDLYGDFTDQSTNVNKGASYAVSVSPTFSWEQWDEYIRVWIDYNRDGDFDDIGEVAFSAIRPGAGFGAGSFAISGTIQIPNSANEGATRMRVAMKRDDYADPCETFTHGEVEDYMVFINGGGGDFTPPTISLSTANTTVSATFNVSVNFSEAVNGLSLSDFNVTNANVATLSGSGQSYSLIAQPIAAGTVVIELPAASVTDLAGNDNIVSNTLSITYTPNNGGGPLPTGYCTARGQQPWQEWIDRVVFGTIDNSSFKEQYGDYSDQSTDVSKGGDYAISLTPGYSYTRFDEHWRVWIDFNRDGDFEDIGETVLSFIGNAEVNETIQIPLSASTGMTLMRIAMKNGAFADPCETFGRGEVEDYAVNILSSGNGAWNGIGEAVLSFDAQAKGQVVALAWRSNTGHLNDYFLIQHSIDGQTYKEIGQVENGATNDQLLAYRFDDNKPQEGLNYYRLKQVYLDGRYQISVPRKVHIEEELSTLLIYPNPTNQVLQVQLPPAISELVQITIYNNMGQALKQFIVSEIDTRPIAIELAGLQDGIYHLNVQISERKSITQRFVVLNE